MRTACLARTLTSALFLLGAVNACTSDEDPSLLAKGLAGRDFLLEEANGYEPVAGTRLRLGFSGSELQFNAGCNTYAGPYELEDSSLVVIGLGSTEMGCAEELIAQDQWLDDFFTSEPGIALEGDTLTLTTNEASLTFLDREVADPDRTLTGQPWTVDTFMTGDTAASLPMGLVEPSVNFADDGSLVIETGCNQGTGTYAATTNELTFSEVSFTESTCSDPDATAVATHLTEVFADGTATYNIEAARLTIERDGVGVAALANE